MSHQEDDGLDGKLGSAHAYDLRLSTTPQSTFFTETRMRTILTPHEQGYAKSHAYKEILKDLLTQSNPTVHSDF